MILIIIIIIILIIIIIIIMTFFSKITNLDNKTNFQHVPQYITFHLQPCNLKCKQNFIYNK